MSRRCILQIEDEESDVILLKHAFKKAGIDAPVFVATDGAEAIAYFTGTGQFADRREFPLPCLVLLDLKLPDKNGIEILQWIREQVALQTTVVVALTSSDHDGDIRSAYESGVNSYVVKPSNNQKRIEFAQNLKGWWLGCNQLCVAS